MGDELGQPQHAGNIGAVQVDVHDAAGTFLQRLTLTDVVDDPKRNVKKLSQPWGLTMGAWQRDRGGTAKLVMPLGSFIHMESGLKWN